MSLNSKIEWTHATWNPVTGCSKISQGCINCYAERMSKRLKAMGCKPYKNGFEVTTHDDLLCKPLEWQKPYNIFVNSMSDLFHEKVQEDFIFSVFQIMKEAKWHIFQILTKRSDRLKKFSRKIEWPQNVWMGVTIESECYINRLDDVLSTDACVKFISFEPLLSKIQNLNLHGIDWVIVGGESGPNARQMEKEWVLDIYDQCKMNNIPFFFKQWGGKNKKKTGRSLNGIIISEMPQIKYV